MRNTVKAEFRSGFQVRHLMNIAAVMSGTQRDIARRQLARLALQAHPRLSAKEVGELTGMSTPQARAALKQLSARYGDGKFSLDPSLTELMQTWGRHGEG